MKKFSAYILTAPYQIDLVEIELGEVPKHYVVVEVAYCALCASDIIEYKGGSDISYPKSIGHEFVGTVTEVGQGVTRVERGDTVSSDLTYRCGECQYCKRGLSHMCTEEAKGLFSNRGFAQFLHIHEDYLYKVNGIKPLFRASLVEPLACAIHAVELGAPQAADSILVLGCGGVGTLAGIYIKALGMGEKLTLSDKDSMKELRVASSLGNVNRLDDPALFSLIIDATGDPTSVERACSLLDKGGRLIIVSRYHADRPLTIPHRLIATKEGLIQFSHHNGEPCLVYKAIELLERDWAVSYDSLFQVEPISRLLSCYDDYDSKGCCKWIFDIRSIAIEKPC